jgi:hypothetical protein
MTSKWVMLISLMGLMGLASCSGPAETGQAGRVAVTPQPAQFSYPPGVVSYGY